MHRSIKARTFSGDKDRLNNAKVAQLVEHDLAKVGVAGSNPVSRSTSCPGGGIGRHAGLKILWPLGRAGSSPARGTKQKALSFLLFLCLPLSF